MRVKIHASADIASKHAAEQIISGFSPSMKLGVATGSTPLRLYSYLREAHGRGEFSLAGCTAWALDEYVGLPADHPEGYRNVLLNELVRDGGVGLDDAGLHTPNGAGHDPQASAKAYEEEIGDGVDIQILGLGSNGHIGFNEPSGSLASRTHVGVLNETTRRDNARFFDGDLDKVPTHCITQGLATIMSAREIILLAFGPHKAEAVTQMVEGAVSQFWPATILQHHPNVTVHLDEEAAAGLQLADYYKTINAN